MSTLPYTNHSPGPQVNPLKSPHVLAGPVNFTRPYLGIDRVPSVHSPSAEYEVPQIQDLHLTL
ncbi:hypothetical protein SAMN04489729_0290 [Amycolatopsis lurida]|uniref:hypothetical protein n=1 Tax=Amycolatopsis lurida TaxID=31959 RepID=UPI000551606A|nr:hypothetical protein [Amycolatopsis lurida]SEB32537.1 hypothetical protein SAMN04489729_0290 [Amycolatopsis lurida]